MEFIYKKTSNDVLIYGQAKTQWLKPSNRNHHIQRMNVLTPEMRIKIDTPGVHKNVRRAKYGINIWILNIGINIARIYWNCKNEEKTTKQVETFGITCNQNFPKRTLVRYSEYYGYNKKHFFHNQLLVSQKSCKILLINSGRPISVP